MQRLPQRSEGYTLDLNSTVFERYGKQEGALKGHNPRQHGRRSHHLLLAVLNEAHSLLYGWLRSGNLDQRRLPNIVVARLTLWVMRGPARGAVDPAGRQLRLKRLGDQWRRRADVENRIAELKHELGADGFCLKLFFATEAAFRSVLLLFNLLAEFQRAAGPGYREPTTIRTQVPTCGAILARSGRRFVVPLSQSWG